MLIKMSLLAYYMALTGSSRLLPLSYTINVREAYCMASCITWATVWNHLKFMLFDKLK